MKMKNDIISGVIDSLKHKIEIHENELEINAVQEDKDEAYQHQMHLLKVKDQLQRNNNLRKAQTQNKRTIEQNYTIDYD